MATNAAPNPVLSMLTAQRPAGGKESADGIHNKQAAEIKNPKQRNVLLSSHETGSKSLQV